MTDAAHPDVLITGAVHQVPRLGVAGPPVRFHQPSGALRDRPSLTIQAAGRRIGAR